MVRSPQRLTSTAGVCPVDAMTSRVQCTRFDSTLWRLLPLTHFVLRTERRAERPECANDSSNENGPSTFRRVGLSKSRVVGLRRWRTGRQRELLAAIAWRGSRTFPAHNYPPSLSPRTIPPPVPVGSNEQLWLVLNIWVAPHIIYVCMWNPVTSFSQSNESAIGPN